jgi:hypothetical protein
LIQAFAEQLTIRRLGNLCGQRQTEADTFRLSCHKRFKDSPADIVGDSGAVIKNIYQNLVFRQRDNNTNVTVGPACFQSILYQIQQRRLCLFGISDGE